MYESVEAIGVVNATPRVSGVKVARGVWTIGISRISSTGPFQSDSVDHFIGKCCRRVRGTQTSEWRSLLPFGDAFFAHMYTAPTETIDHLVLFRWYAMCTGPNTRRAPHKKHPNANLDE
jgi:hypothetical protein